MKITDIKTLAEYDVFCREHAPNKIPQWYKGDWKYRVGDCIYNYSNGDNPVLRKGVHNEDCRPTDINIRLYEKISTAKSRSAIEAASKEIVAKEDALWETNSNIKEWLKGTKKIM